ncbi:MAG TPA: hypothetical protein VKE74_19645, partial [Gemmataceae bacterium]|nr:hypothetical protein [Gemmataceae bacterium]
PPPPFDEFGGRRPGRPPIPPGQPGSPEAVEEAKAWDSFTASFDALPPATVTVRRVGNELQLEVWQPRAQDGGLIPVIDAGLGWFDKRLNRYYDPNGNPIGSPSGYIRPGRFR